MKTPWLKLASLLFVFLLAAGCQTSTKLGDVTVKVIDMRPLGTTALESQAELTLRYINGNVFAIAVSHTSHKLYLNGEYVGTAQSSDPVGLPRVGTNTQKVTLYLENLKLVKKLRDAAASKDISYRLDSVLSAEVTDEVKRIKTSSSGQLDLTTFLATPAR